jgi:hypothetical protein
MSGKFKDTFCAESKMFRDVQHIILHLQVKAVEA